MPPQVSRYPPQNLSNPFAHLNQQNLHQASHLQHPTVGLGGHGLGGHPGFGSSSHNGGISIFGPQSAASGLQGGFGGAALGNGTGLASHAAQMGFAHGAALQQQAHDAAILGTGQPKGQASRIREVWKNNLAEEMSTLRSLIDRYPYVSMDTEFPGVVARPIGEFGTKASYHYQTLRCNVDLLKIIQLGITLFSIEGEAVPPTELAAAMSRGVISNNIKICPCTWTFNFRFSPEEDMYNEESLNLLKKAGSDFEKHLTMGIDPDDFGSLLITSGMVMSDDVYWISFHSGYDFAYLVKLMKPELLPENEDHYRELVKIFFPNIYDVKFMLRHAQKLLQRGILPPHSTSILNNLGTKSGLQDLAEELNCQRIGVQHQAGSDAWLTGTVFWQMRTKVFDGQIPEELNGEMWGLTGVGPPASASVQAAMLASSHGHGATGLSGAASSMFHSSLTPSTHRADPATPTNNIASLAQQTPGQGGHGYTGGLTPGAGGVFGNFQPANMNLLDREDHSPPYQWGSHNAVCKENHQPNSFGEHAAPSLDQRSLHASSTAAPHRPAYHHQEHYRDVIPSSPYLTPNPSPVHDADWYRVSYTQSAPIYRPPISSSLHHGKHRTPLPNRPELQRGPASHPSLGTIALALFRANHANRPVLDSLSFGSGDPVYIPINEYPRFSNQLSHHGQVSFTSSSPAVSPFGEHGGSRHVGPIATSSPSRSVAHSGSQSTRAGASYGPPRSHGDPSSPVGPGQWNTYSLSARVSAVHGRIVSEPTASMNRARRRPWNWR